MPPLTGLAAADLRTAVLRYRDALRAHQEELNRLNVYPVPDGDTGTNMALTLEAVSTELATAETMAEVCHAMSRGSLMGARGNSGLILSQVVRGMSEVARDKHRADGVDLGNALTRGAQAAYQAVGHPVEGTILTVVREVAETVESRPWTSLLELLEGGLRAANDAVARTPELLPVLRAKRDVDRLVSRRRRSLREHQARDQRNDHHVFCPWLATRRRPLISWTASPMCRTRSPARSATSPQSASAKSPATPCR